MTDAPTDGIIAEARLDFWFEFASTYSYLSALRIRETAANAGVTVIWRPFLLGPIFTDQGWSTSPFNIYPAKGRYMWRDVARLAASRSLLFKKPEVFPQNGLHAARLALAALDKTPDLGAEFCVTIYRAQFEDGEDISSASVLEGIAQRVGLPDSMLEESRSAETKDALRHQTERARTLGLFGAPSFTIGDELFWGDDRLEHALAYARTAGVTPQGTGAAA